MHPQKRVYPLSPLRLRYTSVLALLLGTALLVAGCTDTGLVSHEGAPSERRAGAAMADNGTVTIPFKAEFFTELVSLAPDEECGAPPNFLNTQKGFGEATHLGRFSARPSFCINMADLLDDGQLTDGELLPYGPNRSALVAANGDKLWVVSSGAVVPSDHPDFDFEFTNPFEFTGGTGRFEGARGGGFQQGLVDQQASRTRHQWSGTLILPRGQ